jgi:hypothetical protein
MAIVPTAPATSPPATAPIGVILLGLTLRAGATPGGSRHRSRGKVGVSVFGEVLTRIFS